MIDKLKNRFVTGAFITDVKHYFSKINEIIDWINTPPYKVYTALLTQVNADAPFATVLENTLGTITYNYLGVGNYMISSDNLFTADKTVVFFGPLNVANTNGYAVAYEQSNPGIITIVLYDLAGYSINNIGDKLSIEIRVYN